MTDADILTLLLSDLGEISPSADRAAFLRQSISAAQSFITREGATLNLESVEDVQLVEMYAAYLVRKRATNEPMPRMLRWALNNRIFSEKAVNADAT